MLPLIRDSGSHPASSRALTRPKVRSRRIYRNTLFRTSWKTCRRLDSAPPRWLRQCIPATRGESRRDGVPRLCYCHLSTGGAAIQINQRTGNRARSFAQLLNGRSRLVGGVHRWLLGRIRIANSIHKANQKRLERIGLITHRGCQIKRCGWRCG
jgi:hypothetical protein